MKNTLLLLACTVVALVAAACAAPEAPRVQATAKQTDVVDANIGFIAGRICNQHLGEVLHAMTLDIIDESGTRTSEDIATDDDGIFKVPASVGRSTVIVRAEGFDKAFAVDVVAAQTSILENNANGACE